jgi:quercetin dioxygenase-like cupin family protein
MQKMFNEEPLSEELLKHYQRKTTSMTADERQEYVDKKREQIFGWASPLNVQQVKAGSNPEYNNYPVNDDVISSISLVANMWVKQMIFDQIGDVHPGHQHTFDHQTLLSKGSVEVVANGETTVFKAPTIIYIKAGIKHGMMALEDNTVVYCVHPLRGGDQVGDIIDPASVPNGVWPLTQSLEQKLTPTDKL